MLIFGQEALFLFVVLSEYANQSHNFTNFAQKNRVGEIVSKDRILA